MRANLILSLGVALAALPSLAEEGDVKVDYHGAGWLQSGRVEASYALPGEGNAYKNNWVGQSGGLLSIHTAIDANWDGSLGMGAVLVQLARGARAQANKWYTFWAPWVDEARLSYTHPSGEDREFKLTLGSFHYGYNPDIKNFGQYLLHGYVYPGTIVTSLTGPLGVNQNLTGAMGSFKFGAFSDDLIANIETEDKPLYDISFADVATWKLGAFAEIGAGVNFYRALASNPKATSPGKDCNQDLLGPYAKRGQKNACYILVDSVGTDTLGNVVYRDTVTGSLAGTKLMGRLRVDPKAFFGGQGVFGKNDFVFYTEVAVLGLKNYPQFYDKIARRIPVMFGLNLPGFKYVDWSVEVEYYPSRISGDNLAAESGSWLPTIDAIDTKRDDWKYSFNASAVLGGHAVLMGQIANDDLRLGGNHDDASGKLAMRTPTDWYWTTKIAYFF
jgi:hypothetical protein